MNSYWAVTAESVNERRGESKILCTYTEGRSEAEAVGNATLKLEKTRPTADGWRHRVMVVRIPNPVELTRETP